VLVVTLSSRNTGVVDLGLEQFRPSDDLFEDALAVAEEFPAILIPVVESVDRHDTTEGWARLCAELSTGEVEMTSPPE
jgi:hypothetical protein